MSIFWKIGLVAVCGSKTCAGYPGSIDHMEQDAKVTNWWEAIRPSPPTPRLSALQFNLATNIQLHTDRPL